jgi:hypothetical protein
MLPDEVRSSASGSNKVFLVGRLGVRVKIGCVASLSHAPTRLQTSAH